MEIVTSRQDNQIEAKLEIPFERVAATMQQIAQSYANRVMIPGFRRGKAPLNLVKAHIGEERIREDAVDRLLEEAIEEFYRREKVTPLFTPQAEIEPLEEGQPLRITLLVDPWPEVELPPVAGIHLHLPPVLVGEVEAEEAIHRLRSSYADYRTKEGQAAFDDSVFLKWRLEGDGDWRTDFFELGSEQVLSGFDEQLVGLSAGEEKTFQLIAREQPVSFQVEVVEVKEKLLPAEDEVFAGHFGLQTMEEVRVKVEGELREQAERRYHKALREELVQRYLEKIPLDFSAHAQEEALEKYRASYSEMLKRKGRTFEQMLSELGISDAEWTEAIGRKTAVELLKEQIVLAEIARQRQIEVSKEEIEAEQAVHHHTDEEGAYGALRRIKSIDLLVAEWKASSSRLEQEDPESSGDEP
ncbi:MAG: trigger factor [Coprothermobacterota bacterium]|nr:trigger factor [Coprothermobacterota bacterium]